MITPLAGSCATPAVGGLFASTRSGKTALFMGPPSKVKNENVDDFATYLAKRQAAAEGRAWTPAGKPPPTAAAAPVAAAAGPPSKIKNANVDDFATYMAKRQAAADGKTYSAGAGAGTTTLNAYMPSSTPQPAQAGPRSSEGKWVAPDSYATRTLGRDKPFPGSHQAAPRPAASGGTHDSSGKWKHYGYGGYTPKK